MRRCGRRGSRIAPSRRQLARWALAPGTTRSSRQGARRVLRHLSRRGAVTWLRIVTRALRLGAIAGQVPVGGAEKDARLMLPSPRACGPWTVPSCCAPRCRAACLRSSPPAPLRATSVTSISGARIASSECVRITQDACASELSNGFAQNTRIDSLKMHAMWRVGCPEGAAWCRRCVSSRGRCVLAQRRRTSPRRSDLQRGEAQP